MPTDEIIVFEEEDTAIGGTTGDIAEITRKFKRKQPNFFENEKKLEDVEEMDNDLEKTMEKFYDSRNIVMREHNGEDSMNEKEEEYDLNFGQHLKELQDFEKSEEADMEENNHAALQRMGKIRRNLKNKISWRNTHANDTKQNED